MFALTTRSHRLTSTRPQPTGVFDDDALLLRLAERAGFVESTCPQAAVLTNSDDLALETARLVDVETWDL